MTDKSILQALRCCAEGECKDCAMHEDKQRCQENLLDKAAEAIERLTTENAALREKPRWIPVAERLPERDVQVLGWYKDNPFSQYRPGVVAWNGNGWVLYMRIGMLPMSPTGCRCRTRRRKEKRCEVQNI